MPFFFRNFVWFCNALCLLIAFQLCYFMYIYFFSHNLVRRFISSKHLRWMVKELIWVTSFAWKLSMDNRRWNHGICIKPHSSKAPLNLSFHTFTRYDDMCSVRQRPRVMGPAATLLSHCINKHLSNEWISTIKKIHGCALVWHWRADGRYKLLVWYTWFTLLTQDIKRHELCVPRIRGLYSHKNKCMLRVHLSWWIIRTPRFWKSAISCFEIWYSNLQVPVAVTSKLCTQYAARFLLNPSSLSRIRISYIDIRNIMTKFRLCNCQ